MGLQKIASYCAIGTYYVIAIPVACILGFRADLGIAGLLIGYFAAVIVQATAYMCILRLNRWQDVANAAAERIRDEEERLAALKDADE